MRHERLHNVHREYLRRQRRMCYLLVRVQVRSSRLQKSNYSHDFFPHPTDPLSDGFLGTTQAQALQSSQQAKRLPSELCPSLVVELHRGKFWNTCRTQARAETYPWIACLGDLAAMPSLINYTQLKESNRHRCQSFKVSDQYLRKLYAQLFWVVQA
jgi:hypothetical protein